MKQATCRTAVGQARPLLRADTRLYFRFRRLIDVLVSAIALIILLPVMGAVAALVLADVGQPVIFRQVRPGRHMRPFKLYKFRTMGDAYNCCSGSQFCDYERISPLGRLLRRTRLDELPQLYNVLIGDMALIGPRPLLPRDLPKGPAAVERAALRPGITGWAQVHGGQQLNVMEKMALDCWYARHASAAVDARIVVLTIKMMIWGEHIDRRKVAYALHAMQPSKRLFFVVNDTAFFVSHRLPLAVEAREAGFDVHLAALDDGYLDVLERHGITFHPLRINRTGTNLLQDTRLLLQLLQILRLMRPVLIHTVTIKPVIYGGISARWLKIPALVSAVSGLGFVFTDGAGRKQLVRRLVRRLYRFALAHGNSRVIFQNPDDLQEFITSGLVPLDRAVLIRGSGVNMALFKPTPEPSGVPVVVLPARMLWDKGVGEFVEAARLVRTAGIAARFALVGRPPAHNRNSVPREAIEAWVREGIVEWWGFRDDMPAVYAQSHVVCLPSYYREGVPKALIEAAACGRPIVTTDTPGCREIVRHGESGLLVHPRSADSLAEALLQLLYDAECRRRMGQRGRELAATEFALEHVLGKTLATYRDVLDEAGFEAGSFSEAWRGVIEERVVFPAAPST